MLQPMTPPPMITMRLARGTPMISVPDSSPSSSWKIPGRHGARWTFCRLLTIYTRRGSNRKHVQERIEQIGTFPTCRRDDCAGAIELAAHAGAKGAGAHDTGG